MTVILNPFFPWQTASLCRPLNNFPQNPISLGLEGNKRSCCPQTVILSLLTKSQLLPLKAPSAFVIYWLDHQIIPSHSYHKIALIKSYLCQTTKMFYIIFQTIVKKQVTVRNKFYRKIKIYQRWWISRHKQWFNAFKKKSLSRTVN